VIIDMRCRLTTTSGAEYFRQRMGERAVPAMKEGSAEAFFKELDEAGVTTAVSVSGNNLGMKLDHVELPARTTSNDEQAELQRKYPGRFVGVAGIDPGNAVHNGLEELERCVKELGLKAAFIEPGREPLLVPHLADPRLYPFYSLAQELGVAVIPQTSGPLGGKNIDYAHPKYIDQIAEDFKNLTIICGHGCYPFTREVITVASRRRRNVYVSPDIYIFSPGTDDWIAAVNSDTISHKFIFGSAYPLCGNLKSFVDRFMALPWDKEKLDNILYKNALRALKLEDDPVFKEMYKLEG